ncbi:hypothetical protein [Phaeovulum sp. W22_SRMD_FR3]|uniref:hypothetical protein n=1 Tax=Phaeovulum sp. W22_SRMD_FR3 TaxID=3240274 RepID=UPI003F954D44
MKAIHFSCLISLSLLLPGPICAQNFTVTNQLESGQWGWPSGENSCAQNPQSLRFSADLSTMTYSWAHTHDPSVYRVVTLTDTAFRSRIEGETRLTEAGNPVEWDLRMVDANHFCWHRADWPPLACTKMLERCSTGNS